MASGKSNKSIKNSPEFFSDEPLTVEERILDTLQQKHSQTLITDFSELEDTLSECLSSLPPEEIRQAEDIISELLDKYYNGDRDVPQKQRFLKREEHKQNLISALKNYGISYVEKYHYPLSYEEKHIIRMDFYGRINKPRINMLSRLYKACLRNKFSDEDEEENESQIIHKKKKKKHAHQNFSTSQYSHREYPLSDYDLNISKAWGLFRLFPRFHNLESKMLKTIQSMGIPPELLSQLSVYDYSDILYRTFRKSEKSPDAHLFLGARQAFVKDVFKKNEQWIRNYLTRQNVHPRYIDALMKMAQGKGILNDINIASDDDTFMSEFATFHNKEFQEFIIENIRSDNYADEIRNQIQNNSFTIEGPALHFLQNTKNQFKQAIKKQLLETNYLDALYYQFNRQIPFYVLDDIKTFLKSNEEDFSLFLSEMKISQKTKKIIKDFPNKIKPQNWKTIEKYLLTHQDDFYVHLLDNSRSPEYARFALQSLSETPILTDFGKDIVFSFLSANKDTIAKIFPQETLKKIEQNGLTDEVLLSVTPFIKQNFSFFKKYVQNNNILTFNELQNELIETRKLIIQNGSMPDSMNNLNKGFVLSHTSIFKDWYINFHTKQYKENASQTYEQISLNGINASNIKTCSHFIKERLSNFIEYAEQYNIPSAEIIKTFKEDNLINNQNICGIAHDFITKYSSAFKSFLLQKHLEQKENNFEVMIKNIKQNGITEKNAGNIHKFIIDNQALYVEYQKKNKLINPLTDQIYENIINNRSNEQEKSILKDYLNQNIFNYMIFQQDDTQLFPYVKGIIQNIKHLHIDSTEQHWLRAFTQKNPEKFKDFMVSQQYISEDKGNDLIKSIKQTKKNLKITFKDGYVLKLKMTVHHKKAIKDSGELAQNLKSIAEINNFSNLCVFIDFWHTIIHSLDSKEPLEDKERFVARLEPTDDNMVIYGGAKKEDQLSYNYKNDNRTIKYNKKLSHQQAIISGYTNE